MKEIKLVEKGYPHEFEQEVRELMKTGYDPKYESFCVNPGQQVTDTKTQTLYSMFMERDRL